MDSFLVCSKHDSPSFMIKCIQEGAGDYILKPLTEDVVKTLFLVRREREREILVEREGGGFLFTC